ncbi:MAG TPA: DUF559 domain-containing protein [Flavobacteriales bacterium]|nr:DUF559 domain-containing protein [Flavobacteriales bacterium]
MKGGKLRGYGFHRQWPMFGYIADFYCAELRLIVEVDGGIHNTPERQAHDAKRTDVLNGEGFQRGAIHQ